jgi:magnesium-transporting ATPase (P-type)
MLFPGTPLAMTVMGVLAVDVGTDLIPAMGLGIEPPEKGIMERPPRQRKERLLSLKLILRSYFVQGSLLASSCYATYFYTGWILGYWHPGLGPSTMPSSPSGLKLEHASSAYLQTLTAYFFPTVTTQIANVLCKRSWKTSLFARDFLSPPRRKEILERLSHWRPQPYSSRVEIQIQVSAHAELAKAFFALLRGTVSTPFRFFMILFSSLAIMIERPVIIPFLSWLSRFLAKHYVLLNLFSNPLIDLGILFELFLCYLFFYTALAEVYYFAPVPWHVYLFALHGTVVLVVFEEVKKLYRRRGYPLEALG